MSHGFGGRVSYTYSALTDNQVGETNFYSLVSPGLPLNNFNYIASMPRCAPGAQYTTACYDPRAEYGRGMLDVPHRLIIAPLFELPFVRNQKWANNSKAADWIIGGWSVSMVANVQSGFPINVQQTDNTNLLGGAQRPNLSGQAIGTAGNYQDRLATADHPTATWVSAAGFTLATAGTFGTAPRTITSVRSPSQKNVDAVFMKNFRVGETKTVQVKVEMLNLLNRVEVTSATSNNVTSSTFGQIGNQAGFMRITQLMFRYSF
jgi:hypothetical protein